MTTLNQYVNDKKEISVDKDIIAIIREQIISCQKDITTYNSIFVSSSVLSSILAALASVISSINSNNDILWNFFYLLPTIYFLSLYNLVKYTTEQMKLGLYRNKLEKCINEIFDDTILYWERDIQERTSTFATLGGVIQFVFFVPIAVFMVWGFWKIQHDVLWVFMFIFTILQIISVLIMIIHLVMVVIQQK